LILYVLPYGQMSLWGATVITNLLSAIPFFGQSLVELIWTIFYEFYKLFNYNTTDSVEFISYSLPVIGNINWSKVKKH